MRLTNASVKHTLSDTKGSAVDDLVAILRLAYSGELAAALAYRGHWKSVSDAEDRKRIRQVEEEEWRHRGLVGAMLRDLGESPGRSREARALLIGRTPPNFSRNNSITIPYCA